MALTGYTKLVMMVSTTGPYLTMAAIEKVTINASIIKSSMHCRPWKNSRRCDNQCDPFHTKCKTEMDLCHSITSCGQETASLVDTGSVHMPEMQDTFQH